jgi:phosphoserine aminotransferase
MSERVFNFSAGPATLDQGVLEASAAALVDYQGAGVGIAEVSHRGKEFLGVLEECEARCRSLLGLDDDHVVLFLQGGATQQFDLLPMNFLSKSADYLVSGSWAKKAAQAGARYGDARVIGDSSDDAFTHLPAGWEADPDADYLHLRWRPEEPRALRRGAGDSPQGLPRAREGRAGAHLQLRRPHQGRLLSEYPAHLRHLRAAGNLPLA